MKKSDLVSVRAFPSVVQAADIRVLREHPQSAATRDFVGGYLGFDARARHATETLMRSLASPNGGAFFLNGVFGSGKSHLLGVVALLCDLSSHEEFSDAHPHLQAELSSFAPRFVVHFSLDDYAAAKFSLEEIFWCEAAREWVRRGFSPDEMVLPHNASRGESWALWEENLARQNLHGTVVCIDELSLFLSGREHRALQNDAAFLQFSAQRARRSQSSPNTQSSTRCALWVVAALQKTIEDIGDLDAYALSQIRDRFQTLPLSLAHLPSLIERRLVAVKDATELARFCDESYDEALRALPHLDFGRDEWRRLFPFHPTTVLLLESFAARFGSRTRSAVVFCQNLDLESAARDRVCADELFGFWENEMPTFPDLKPLFETWRAWQQLENELARDPNEAQTMRALMQSALLFAATGKTPTVAALANAILLDARLPGDGNYEYARVLLEKMRLGGAGFALERREGIFADRYAVDVEARAGELARRFTLNALHTLPNGDRRVAQYVARCCDNDALPLSTLSNARNYDAMWLHSPRVVSVETVECAPSPETLANRLAALDQANSDVDFLLFLELPFGVGSPSSTRFGFDKDAQKQSQSWRENVEKALSLLRERDDTTDWNRWRHALAWWLPRVATASEWESAREATAQNQLLHDPQLADNARGRSVLAHLREGLAARENMLSQLGARLLREGALANGGGLWIEAGELALGENWASSLEAVAQWVLPELFPRFAEVAPRLRVLSPSSVDALCLETLRRPTQTPFFAASLERSVRAIAQPLGMAQESGGRWLIGSPTSARCELARDFFAFFDERGASLSWLETALSKGIWGLNALQTRLLACAFLHSGEIVAFDARGRALAPAEIGLPLSRSVHVLRAGLLPDEDIWQKLQEIAQLLTGENRLERSFENQEKTRALLTNWRDETVAQSELAQARLHQWQRVSPQNASAERARESLNATVQTLQDAAFSPVVDLARVALLPPEIVRQDLESWRVVTQKLETHHAPLLEHWSFLRHADLVAPIEMAESRQDLLSRFDGFLDDETLLRDATNWRIEYSNRYAKWHNAQHASERFAPFLRLLESDTARVLSRLATIQTRDFPFAAQLQSAVHIELQKACRRDGTLAGEPVCTSCRLAFGGSLTLRDAREIETVAQNGIAVFRQSLREESVRALVENSEIGAPLLGWNQENGDANALLPILTREAALLLEDAFRPRRRVSRSWQELQSSTRSCRTKSDWQRAFALWLEGAENPGDDDEIEIAE